MRDLASIQKVVELQAIEGADRIELATVLGWNVIVQKGQFEVGDLVIYIEYDTVLPLRKEFEFLRARCYSEIYDGLRIQSMMLKGAYSQGIVFPTSILPRKVKFEEGTVVAEDLSIRRYDHDEVRELLIERKALRKQKQKRKGIRKFLFKYKFFRKLFLPRPKKTSSYPENISKSSETNIQAKYPLLNSMPEILYYVTEKLEGQASAFSQFEDRFSVYSHNVKLAVNADGNWQNIARKYSIEKKLKDYEKEHGVELCIQGEIIGEGIQKNIYGVKGLDFYVYRIKNLTYDFYLEFEELKEACEVLGLNIVPIIAESITLNELGNSVKELLDYAGGTSVLNDVKREGIVIRSIKDQNIGAKIKCPLYDIWFNKKMGTE